MQDLPFPTDNFVADSEDLYLEATCVYGKGHTFMDVFDADEYKSVKIKSILPFCFETSLGNGFVAIAVRFE